MLLYTPFWFSIHPEFMQTQNVSEIDQTAPPNRLEWKSAPQLIGRDILNPNVIRMKQPLN